MSIEGEPEYLWLGVDQDRYSIDILVQRLRNKKAALRFFRLDSHLMQAINYRLWGAESFQVWKESVGV